jgi:hypothetical protein
MFHCGRLLDHIDLRRILAHIFQTFRMEDLF